MKVGLKINGKHVAETNGYPLESAFECFAQVHEQFQVHVFTMPSSIVLEIFVGGDHVCDLPVDVPGMHVKALTCASQIVERKDFSKWEYDQSLLPPNKKRVVYRDQRHQEEEEKKAEAAEARARETDVAGEIYYKVEWKGNGPKMPPVKSENLFKRGKVEKNRKEWDEIATRE